MFIYIQSFANAVILYANILYSMIIIWQQFGSQLQIYYGLMVVIKPDFVTNLFIYFKEVSIFIKAACIQ